MFELNPGSINIRLWKTIEIEKFVGTKCVVKKMKFFVWVIEELLKENVRGANNLNFYVFNFNFYFRNFEHLEFGLNVKFGGFHVLCL